MGRDATLACRSVPDRLQPANFGPWITRTRVLKAVIEFAHRTMALALHSAPWAIGPQASEAQVPRNAVTCLLKLDFLQERCANNIAIVFEDLLAKTLQRVFVAIYQFGPFDS
jgi:hypothetical protein